jgi:hypothetical protein
MATKLTRTPEGHDRLGAVSRELSAVMARPRMPAQEAAVEDTKIVMDRYRNELQAALRKMTLMVDAQA